MRPIRVSFVTYRSRHKRPHINVIRNGEVVGRIWAARSSDAQFPWHFSGNSGAQFSVSTPDTPASKPAEARRRLALSAIKDKVKQYVVTGELPAPI